MQYNTPKLEISLMTFNMESHGISIIKILLENEAQLLQFLILGFDDSIIKVQKA